MPERVRSRRGHVINLLVCGCFWISCSEISLEYKSPGGVCCNLLACEYERVRDYFVSVVTNGPTPFDKVAQQHLGYYVSVFIVRIRQVGRADATQLERFSIAALCLEDSTLH